MAFGGLGGIAGAIYVQADSIHPAGQYVAVSQNGRPSSVAADNIFWRKSGPGDTPPGVEDANNSALQYLSIASIADEVETNFLDECDGTNDVGTLTTEAPSVATAGTHSLPANFGRGQNKWRPGDEDYIDVWFRMPQLCQGAPPGALIIQPLVNIVEFLQFGTSEDAQSVLGNIRIEIINSGGAVIPAGTGGFPAPPIMNVEFVHTLRR
jgi:hypothetical protein